MERERSWMTVRISYFVVALLFSAMNDSLTAFFSCVRYRPTVYHHMIAANSAQESLQVVKIIIFPSICLYIHFKALLLPSLDHKRACFILASPASAYFYSPAAQVKQCGFPSLIFLCSSNILPVSILFPFSWSTFIGSVLKILLNYGCTRVYQPCY